MQPCTLPSSYSRHDVANTTRSSAGHVLVVIELEFLQGRARLSGYDVHSLIQY